MNAMQKTQGVNITYGYLVEKFRQTDDMRGKMRLKRDTTKRWWDDDSFARNDFSGMTIKDTLKERDPKAIAEEKFSMSLSQNWKTALNVKGAMNKFKSKLGKGGASSRAKSESRADAIEEGLFSDDADVRALWGDELNKDLAQGKAYALALQKKWMEWNRQWLHTHSDNEYFMKQMHLYETWKLKGLQYTQYMNEQQKRKIYSQDKDYRKIITNMAKPKGERAPLRTLKEFEDQWFLKANTMFVASGAFNNREMMQARKLNPEQMRFLKSSSRCMLDPGSTFSGAWSWSMTQDVNKLTDKVVKDVKEWKAVLTLTSFNALREWGTEPANTGEYTHFFPGKGYFCCMGCGLPLYAGTSKYDASSGWPAFEKAYHSKHWGCHIWFKPDNSYAMNRTEILCKRCDGHLGHIFFDESGVDTERHNVNSVCLKHIEGSEPPLCTTWALKPEVDAAKAAAEEAAKKG